MQIDKPESKVQYAAIVAFKDSFELVRFSAFFWDQEMPN